MRRQELIWKIRIAAKERDLEFILVREGGRHERWRCGDVHVSIPRHREINEYTVERIYRDLEGVLGRRWWR